jgi:hypothetical protein
MIEMYKIIKGKYDKDVWLIDWLVGV